MPVRIQIHSLNTVTWEIQSFVPLFVLAIIDMVGNYVLHAL